MCDYKTIAETKKFIVLDKYDKCPRVCEGYQSEADLERELIQDLINLGYEYLSDLKSSEKMLNNIRTQLQALNNVQFSDVEWKRFCEEYLDKPVIIMWIRHVRFTMIISTTLSLTTAGFKTFICWTKRT